MPLKKAKKSKKAKSLSKHVPQFPLSESKLQCLEEMLPSLRALNEEFKVPIQAFVELVKAHHGSVVPWLDHLYVDLGLGEVKRTYLARVEHIMAALIQCNHEPKLVLEKVPAELNIPDDVTSKFLEIADGMVSLREVWQGEKSSSEEESSSGDEESESASLDGGDSGKETKIRCKCGKVFKLEQNLFFCRHCGEAVPKKPPKQANLANKCQCGRGFFPESHFCAGCGQARPSCGPESANVCSQCKKSMPEAQAFCQHCGCKNERADKREYDSLSHMLMKCQQCQAMMPKGQPFCSTCGSMNGTGPKATTRQPQFLYDEARETLVDKENPRMKPGAAPKQWQPRPAIHQWAGPKDGTDKFTFKTLKKIQGHMYQAAHDNIPLVIPSLEESIAWVDCSASQRALCETEAQMQILYKVHEQGMTWGAAKRSMGYGAEVYSLAEKQQMANLAQAEEKIAKKMQKAKPKEEFPRQKGDKPWQRKHTEPKGDAATTSEESMKTFNKRIQQLEAALNKGGHVQVDNPKPPKR